MNGLKSAKKRPQLKLRPYLRFFLLRRLHAGLFEDVAEEELADENGDRFGYREGQPDVRERAGKREKVGRGDQDHQLASG